MKGDLRQKANELKPPGEGRPLTFPDIISGLPIE
jgi:hypothetical protein